MSLPYKALFLDLSGVLYDGKTVISGAVEIVAEARRRGLVLRFVTNTATKPATTILNNLKNMGFEVGDGELLTAPMAARAYIEQRQLRPFCLIHRSLRQEFADLNQSDPNCVLLGDARNDLHYENLNQAFQLCHSGAPLIGIGMNKYFKEDGALMLDVGAFIHAIEWAADVRATIMGKPSKGFFDQVVRSTGLAASDCLMVGDDVLGDVVGAVEAGLQGCLVQTGKYHPRDNQHLPERAKLIASVAELFQNP